MVCNTQDDPVAPVPGIACKTMAIYSDWKNRTALHEVDWMEQVDRC